MDKYEQLIEYVINDEADKARELFHEIVVEASRMIYEDIMETEECCDSMGGDDSDDLILDIETDEEGMNEEDDEGFDDEEVEVDFGDEEGDEEDFDVDAEFDTDSDFGDEEGGEDVTISSEKVVDLEDKLDELMAEFEALMSNSDDGDADFGVDGGDELEMDDTEDFEVMTERESTNKRDNRAEKAGRKVTKDIEWDEKHHRFDENIKLQAAPKPVTSEPEGTNKKSINANNSGAVGAVTKPVKMTGDTAHGRANPKVGDLPDAGKFKNVPAKDNSKLSSAPKPVTSQASGVNTRTPFPKD